MGEENNYLEINKASWNNRTDHHVKSEFYDMDHFLKGKSSLNDIELKLLGDIHDKSLLHLQCHFGQDSISLSRLGAKVTGVDLSDKAIEKAKQLTAELNSDTSFVCCDIYSIPKHINEQFDFVFTSYGTIGWLPDLDQWAKVIASSLKPGGRFLIVEFHPVVWMFDDDFDKIGYNYFKSDPIIETENGTYADRNAPISQKSVTWNHSMSEVLNSLIQHDMCIDSLDEFDYSPYDCFNETIEFQPGKYRIKHLGNKIPMVYAIAATKKK